MTFVPWPSPAFRRARCHGAAFSPRKCPGSSLAHQRYVADRSVLRTMHPVAASAKNPIPAGRSPTGVLRHPDSPNPSSRSGFVIPLPLSSIATASPPVVVIWICVAPARRAFWRSSITTSVAVPRRSCDACRTASARA